MQKISTLFKKDPSDLGRVINEVNPENQWVFDGDGAPTRKYDGTACAIIQGKLYKRYDVKRGKQVPANAIPCQEPDEITGHWPHWIPCDRNNPADQYHFEAFDSMLQEDYYVKRHDGTYELCGPKIQKNPEGFINHVLVRHGSTMLFDVNDFSFDGIRDYLAKHDIEGIVFHHINDGRMCKIRKSDFGIKR